ncbi:hypothetical protein PF002_g21068 [Phytophthora fragariae]|uniref:Uncharacterized protein n=1 Tax=Phytophthora fragariae TaxID=53985 RepID=A0A6A3QYX2_9STRA|nr:hypothetical protein PF003_g39610 [Phytophthora fragariae]KAE9086455.1 hypothetical protein PF007_g20771 [Phytophthora fragariae]KAE9203001.1 hypothetical protein PF002_g21068 [Phytophthora fragariae]
MHAPSKFVPSVKHEKTERATRTAVLLELGLPGVLDHLRLIRMWGVSGVVTRPSASNSGEKAGQERQGVPMH